MGREPPLVCVAGWDAIARTSLLSHKSTDLSPGGIQRSSWAGSTADSVRHSIGCQGTRKVIPRRLARHRRGRRIDAAL